MPGDSKKLYKKWAKTYDQDFALNSNYLSPKKISIFFNKHAKNTDTPILDVGAGTGLVGECLHKTFNKKIIGIDISQEMLKDAKLKCCYTSLVEADLTKKIPLNSNSIGAIVSAGTFTHGHVGPECFPELLRITKPGSLFCCGTIYPVFDGLGFGSALANLVSRGKISPVNFSEIDIYAKGDHAHAEDKGIVMIFRKSANID